MAVRMMDYQVMHYQDMIARGELTEEGGLPLVIGPLDPQTRSRVRRADADRLLEWGERILTADRLEQVFAE